MFVCCLSNKLLCSGPGVCSSCYFPPVFCQHHRRLLCPLVSVIVKNVSSLYAHTWKTKTGCCTNCSLFFYGNASFCEWDQHQHPAFVSHMLMTNISDGCVDFAVWRCIVRHYLNEKLPLCHCLLFVLCLFVLYLINFTTMSVLMILQWNCPMLGTLASDGLWEV